MCLPLVFFSVGLNPETHDGIQLPSMSVFLSLILKQVFGQCLPVQYQRHPRSPFLAFTFYKTVELRTAYMKYAPAFLLIPEVFRYFHEGVRKNFWNLIIFAKLIGHFSIKPLPKVHSIISLFDSYQMSGSLKK